MTDWLHLSPILISVFVFCLCIADAAKKRKAARDRVVQPYIGEVIDDRKA